MMMDNMKMQARGKSLKDLVGAMEEDDAKSIPTLVLRISAGPEGIEIEKGNSDGTFTSEGADTETPAEDMGEIESGTFEKEGNGEETDGVASQDMGSAMPESEPDDSGRSMFEMLIEKKKKEKEGAGGY
jgi:hypothetical protein